VSATPHLLDPWTESLDRYENGSKFAGVIYIHGISDNQITGIARRNFGTFRELCGNQNLKNVILVTNTWGEVSPNVTDARVKEFVGEFFKPALDGGAQIAHYNNTVDSAHDIIRRIARNQPMFLRIKRGLVDEHQDITDTAAGQAANEQIRRHQIELEAVREGVLLAREERDGGRVQELEEVARKLQVKMEGMAARYNEARRKVEEVMRQIQEHSRRERERAELEHQRCKGIVDTAVKEAVDKELEEKTRAHHVELKAAQEMLLAFREKDKELRQELGVVTRMVQEKVNRVRVDSEGTKASYNEGKRRMEEATRQVQEQARQERERAEAEHRRRIDDLNERNEEKWRMEEAMKQVREQARQEREEAEADHRKQMDDRRERHQQNSDASAAERAALEQKIDELNKLEALRARCICGGGRIPGIVIACCVTFLFVFWCQDLISRYRYLRQSYPRDGLL
jgi:hypothetical protein